MRLPFANIFVQPDLCVVQRSGNDRGHWSYPLHTHDGWCEFQIVHHGRLDQTINQRVSNLRSGDVQLIRETDQHQLHTVDGRFTNLAVPLSLWHDLARYLGTSLDLARLDAAAEPPRGHLASGHYASGHYASGHHASGQRSHLQADLDLLFRIQDQPIARPVATRVVLSLLSCVMPPDASPTTATIPAWLTQLMHDVDVKLDTKLHRGLDTHALAQLAGYSPEHVARTFQRYLHTTPSAWLNLQRIERAALLLTHTDTPILRIGLDVGFASSSYFSRLFKDRYDQTPHAYRRQHAVGRL